MSITDVQLVLASGLNSGLEDYEQRLEEIEASRPYLFASFGRERSTASRPN